MTFFDEDGPAAIASGMIIKAEPVSTEQLAYAALYEAYHAEAAQRQLQGKAVNKTADMQDLRRLSEDYIDRVAKERDLAALDVVQAKQSVATLLVDLPAKDFA